jgi:GntR family transcriptional regulator
MDFTIDHHSPLPAYAQIQEQVKMALLLGRLRPGDTLPSIRDVEQQVGISRNVVRKAYLALQDSGILNLQHGKGVLVHPQLSYGSRDNVHARSEKLSSELLSRLRSAGISPSAFARFLYQQARTQEVTRPFIIYVDATKAQAEDRAANISSIWQLRIPGLAVDELAGMPKRDFKSFGKILTNYIRYDQVRRIVRNCSEVIPLGLAFSSHTIKEFARLPEHAKVVLVLDKEDYPALRFLLELYRKILINETSEITAVAFQSIKNLPKFVHSDSYTKMIFSNRIWDEIPEELKNSPRVTRPHMEVDLASLESARIQAGVII